MILTLPSIHMNGTSGQELLNQCLDVMRALEAAKKAIQNAVPNARDYYVQGPMAYHAARNEHIARLTAIQGITDQYNTIASHVAETTTDYLERTQPNAR